MAGTSGSSAARARAWFGRRTPAVAFARARRPAAARLRAFAPHLADQLVSGAQRVQSYFAATPDQLTWIKAVPLLGRRLGAAWDCVVEVKSNLRALLEPYTANLEQLMIGAARALADSMVQVLLSLIVATMFWINGDGLLVAVLHDALRRLGGPIAEQALDWAAV
jgi:predicted PurR-regulated permease PerM